MKPPTGPLLARSAAAPCSTRQRRSPWVAWLCLALLAGCRAVPDAKVWNLDQVHEPDGRPSHLGNIQKDTQYQIREMFSFISRGGGPEFGGSEEKHIDDPLGVCLANVAALDGCSSADQRVRGLKIQVFTWLGGECTYALTRERCMRSLARLGKRYAVSGPVRVEPGVEAVTPDEMRGLLRGIVPPARALLGGARDGFDFAQQLEAGCAAVPLERLDRNAARRVIAILNVLLEQDSFETDALAPLDELHQAVAGRCIGLTLASGLQDPAAHVRAAALDACVRMTENRLPALLRAGISDADPAVVTRALKLIAHFGLPAPETEVDFLGTADDYEGAWRDLLLQVLQVVFDGEMAIAACQAAARVAGEPANLRPEYWVDRWTAHLRMPLEP